MPSETGAGRLAREAAEKALVQAIQSIGYRDGPNIALVAIASAIREQTQVMREATGV